MFWYRETNQNRLKIVIAARLCYPKHFPLPEFFWNSERFVYQIFQYCQSKHIRRQIVIPLCYLRKFFQTREFLKHRSVPLRKVSKCSFDIRIFLKHGRLPYENFLLWDRKIFRRRVVIGAPLCYPKRFSTPVVSWYIERLL